MNPKESDQFALVPHALTPAVADQKRRFLDAAVHEFGENGFKDGSVATMMKASGVNKAFTQYHFGTKDEIWQATVEHVLETYKKKVDSFLSKQGISFEQVIRARFEAMLAIPEAARFIAWISVGNGPKSAKMHRRTKEMLAALTDSHPIERLHNVPAAHLFGIAFFAINGYFQMKELAEDAVQGLAPTDAESFYQSLRSVMFANAS